MRQDNISTGEIAELAIEWVKQRQEYIQKSGHPLSPRQNAIATQVGVKHPHKIRLIELKDIPIPEDTRLQQAAQELNFLGPNTLGITLGYGIYLREGYVTDRLLSHEFRHVQQYESAGSVKAFVYEYLHQIFRYGYDESPYELDARAHEIS